MNIILSLANDHFLHFAFLRFRRKFLSFALMFLTAGLSSNLYAREISKDINDSSQINLLLSRLNIDTPGLEKVKAAADEPTLAAAELLAYYRSRTFVKHPSDKNNRSNDITDYMNDKDIATANDALKHIFTGQPAYPSHFCGNDIDWSTNPYPDKEWLWQLNRMSFWDAMAKTYQHTGDEKYAREWCFQVKDWIRKNPLDNRHGYAWRSIEAGIRGYRWTGLFEYFIDAPSFTPDVLVAFLNSCYDHTTFLMTQYRKGSNWALMEAEGLAFLAITFPEFKDAIKWRKEAVMRLNTEINNQVYADGHQRELSISYHTGCIGWFTRTYQLATMNGMKNLFPDSYIRTVEKMCEVPMKLGYPDGTTAQFGDSWSGKPGGTFGNLKRWAQMFNRKDFLYVATEGRAGVAPKETAFSLEQSGFYAMRSGWDKDAICWVLKCGPDGGGHCQPDNGTFELYAGGRHLMPDAGSYIYSGDKENRDWFRQTKVHQTLTLNGGNSAYAPKLRLWKPGNDLDILVVENKSYPELTHRRSVFFVNKKFFVIVDDAFGVGAGNVDLHFQLAPAKATINKKNLVATTDFADGWNVLVQENAQSGIQMEEEEGQVSFVYTKKEPRPAFRFRKIKEADTRGVRFVTVVAPYTGTAPEIDVKITGNPKVGAAHLELEVTTGGMKREIKYDLPDTLVINGRGLFEKDSSFVVLKKNLEDYYLMKKSGDNDLRTIVNKLRCDTVASDQVTLEVYQKQNADLQLVEKYIHSVNKDGSWPDINYKDAKRSGWEPAKHAQRIFFLAKVYKDPDSKFYRDKKVCAALHEAMRFWFQAKLVCPNWWYNEIGVPKTLGPAFIMLKDELSETEMKEAVGVLDNSHFRMTGQNKVWLAGNIFYKAVLTNNRELAQRARDTIASEIKITTNEGIQPDFSFHQHGPQQQFGNYGLAFITGMAFWGRMFNGTHLAFDEEQKAILRNLFYNGYNWINWKGYFDVNSLGRQFFKDAQVNKSLAAGYAAADMIVTDPAHKQMYLDFISRNFSGASKSHFNGDRHFWRSDMSVHRAQNWFSSIKMSSERVKGAEALNSENLKGYYVADGATYIMVDGDEYNNIFPVWNWRKLPGVTCYQSKKPLKVLTIEGYHNNNNFTGGLSDGLNGITAFHLVRDSLTARKAWFFIDNIMICLGADITSGEDELVTTTLNQSFLKGDVYYFDKSIKKMSPEAQFTADDLKWIYHNKVGYYPLQRTQFTISGKKQYGDWNGIAKIYPSHKESAEVFSLEAEHGIRPQRQSYSYAILPSVTLDEVKYYKPSFSVFQNNSAAQIVASKNSKIFMFVIYDPGRFSLTGFGVISFEQAGLYMFKQAGKKWSLTVADPTHKLDKISFTMRGKKYSIDLPENGDAGKSVTKLLN